MTTSQEYQAHGYLGTILVRILLPPGSSFKPYDYTTFIDNNTNVGAGSVLYDSQTPLPGYPCTNKGLPKNGGNCLQDYDFLNPGPLTLRYALGGSRNIPAVKAMLSAVPNDKSDGKVTSINKVISTASAMMANPYISGNSYNCYSDEALTKTTQCYGASAIGDGAFLHLDDHVNGLSTLGRLGKAIPKTYIMKITDAAGKTVSQFTQPKGTQAVKPDSAYIVNDMASDPRASYLPGSCTETDCTALARGGYKFHRYNGWKFAVKTGTTNDGYDGLMTSWSTKYAVVSWVGNHTRHVTLRTSMENLTEPLTRGWMEAAHANDKKPVNWTAPTGLKTLPAFIVRNHIHYGDIEPSPTNDLFPSWYTGKAAANTSQTLDKVSGKIATSCTPSLAKDTQSNSNVSSWNVDIFVGGSASAGSSAAASGNDDVHVCDEAGPSISFANPPTTCTTTCDDMTVVVGEGAHPIDDSARPQFPGTLNLRSNGQTVQTQHITGPGVYHFTAVAGSGSQEFTAEVIDSVLYSASASTTISFASAGPSGLTASGGGNNNRNFSWTGGIGPFTVAITRTSGNGNGTTSNCASTNNSQLCSLPGSGPGSFQAYVKDSTNAQSPAITF